MTQITWQLYHFSELSTDQLYQLLKLRVDVFVVEQQCPYPELDGKDIQPGSRHLLGYQQQQLVAYSRLLTPGCSFAEASIGRILVAAEHRQHGLGRMLVQESIRLAEQLWPDTGIKIGAQSQLTAFYQSCGFIEDSDPYMEDGIEHIDMLITPAKEPL
ncbi:MAG: GNAT family N-acetyltransferase [Motiliproteus sp.]